MSAQEKELLVRGFKALDTGKTGYVSKYDVLNYLLGTGMSHKDAVAKTEQMMKTMDPDNTGKITFANYVAAKKMSEVNDVIKAQGNDQMSMILDNHELAHALKHEEKHDIINRISMHIQTSNEVVPKKNDTSDNGGNYKSTTAASKNNTNTQNVDDSKETPTDKVETKQNGSTTEKKHIKGGSNSTDTISKDITAGTALPDDVTMQNLLDVLDAADDDDDDDEDDE